MSTTSFAVLTKARAKFGKRLTEKDYNNLLSCQNVTEVLSYLKSNTHYSSALNDINEREVHRGRLEALLRQNLFYEFDSLCRYNSSMSSGFTQYVIETIEVQQIVRFLILLHSNSTNKFIYQFPAYFLKHTEFDINKLANTKTYEEFLNVLSSSPFYNILKKYTPDEKGRLHIADIENDLTEYVFSNLMSTVNTQTDGQEQRELRSLLCSINDYNIFSRILRLKKYYHLSPAEIKENLLLNICDISPKIINQMCEAETSSEVFSIMEKTHTGRLMSKIGYIYASDISPRIKYKLARKNMRFSNQPSVVMISFMFVSEIELMNIITIIEGIRYKLDTKTIESLLIY